MAPRYGKPVVLAETAYPFTAADDDGLENIITSTEPYPGYPATPEGQAAMIRAVTEVVAVGSRRPRPRRLLLGGHLDGSHGQRLGPADATSGNGWENQALFGFDDRLLPTVKGFLRR